MSSDLKRFVDELEDVFVQRCGSLDAPARDAFRARIDSLKRAVDEADVAEIGRLTVDALNVLAALLSVITNVMTLLR